MPIFRRHSEPALFERLLKEKDRQIEILADQIDYLRRLLAERREGPVVAPVSLNPSDQPPLVQGLVPFVSEEEEDIRALHDAGRIDDSQLAALALELGLPSLTSA